jgi:hypothetical protein
MCLPKRWRLVFALCLSCRTRLFCAKRSSDYGNGTGLGGRPSLKWILDNQVTGPTTARLGLGQIARPRLQKSIEFLARGLELPRVVAAEQIWTDKDLPSADLRCL